VRVRVLAGQVLERLCGGELDVAKVAKLAQEPSDLAACVAALDFLLCGAGAVLQPRARSRAHTLARLR
jgi:hypothetical protein